MTRELLPQRRSSENLDIELHGIAMSVTVGRYPDGRIGEVFVSAIKSGVTADAICRDAAVMLSLALQHGIPLETIAKAVTRNRDGTSSSFMGGLVDHLKDFRS
jgi:hypothetical protein